MKAHDSCHDHSMKKYIEDDNELQKATVTLIVKTHLKTFNTHMLFTLDSSTSDTFDVRGHAL